MNFLDQMCSTKQHDSLNSSSRERFKFDASDIHIEPEETTVRIRYRLNGVLEDVAYIDGVALKQILQVVWSWFLDWNFQLFKCARWKI